MNGLILLERLIEGNMGIFSIVNLKFLILSYTIQKYSKLMHTT